LASVSQAYFPLAAEWRALVSSQRPADFVVQAQWVQRASGLARALLPWPPGLAFVRERYWLWAGLVAPPQHREK